uniref:Abnormal cell migration protein 18-like fibronectin type I domain-containing protein n=1 Tax=Parascaris univalens TaxID=6257 RepID=A0A915AQ92_PARUN
MYPSSLLIFIVPLLVPVGESAIESYIDAVGCKSESLHVLHYIVYWCRLFNATRKELNPIGCDYTNGTRTKLNRPPLFANEIYNDKYFKYRCEAEPTKYTFKALKCRSNGEDLQIGETTQIGTITYHCYITIDGIVKLRIRKAIHNLCNTTRWQQLGRPCPGVIETVVGSNYASGEAVAFNPLEGNFLQPRLITQPIVKPNRNNTAINETTGGSR